MAKKFKYTQNVLVKSSIKVGAAVGTNYGMAFLDAQVPFLKKNQWLTPVTVFVGSGIGMAVTPKESFGRDAFDGMNIISGVDMVNAFVDMGKAAMAAKEAPAVERVVDARTINKSKNPTVSYVNMARG